MVVYVRTRRGTPRHTGKNYNRKSLIKHPGYFRKIHDTLSEIHNDGCSEWSDGALIYKLTEVSFGRKWDMASFMEAWDVHKILLTIIHGGLPDESNTGT